MTHLGKEIRLQRLMQYRRGRFLDITVDHGIARGVLPGLENIEALLGKIVETQPDALTMQKGIAEKAFLPYAGLVPLVIKCSSYSPYHYSYDTMITSVEEAVQLGADAVAIGVIVGSERQPEALNHLGTFVRDARRYGVPTVAHIYPRGELIPKDEHYQVDAVQYATRLGAEIGVDIIKTHYTGSPESFAKVVEATPAWVVASGGVEAKDAASFLQKARDVVDAGAAGLACGRFVWTHPEMDKLIVALKHILHNDGSVAEAISLMEA